jgi:hypothetical protein
VLDVDIMAIIAHKLSMVHIHNFAHKALICRGNVGSLEGENSEQ